jgi:hypothetical protein
MHRGITARVRSDDRNGGIGIVFVGKPGRSRFLQPQICDDPVFAWVHSRRESGVARSRHRTRVVVRRIYK